MDGKLQPAIVYIVCVYQAQRDAEKEKELKLRHTAVQKSLPRPTEVSTSIFLEVPTVTSSAPSSVSRYIPAIFSRLS